MATQAALGILRNDQHHKPKLWSHLDIDPERAMLPIKEFRGRRTGTTPTWTYSTFSTEPQIERPRSTSLPRIDRTSKFYQNARAGFKYWDGTKDKYRPSDPVKTKYSMGERFNAGEKT